MFYPPSHHLSLSLSTLTPSPTLNTNPSTSLPPPTLNTSNLPLTTTSHLFPLSLSTSSTLSPGANLTTSTLLTANLVSCIPVGHANGIGARKLFGAVARLVVTIVQDSILANLSSSWVRCDDAANSGFASDVSAANLIAGTKASISSRRMEATG